MRCTACSVTKKPADACFDYLARGGKFAEEPVSILSGVSRNKRLLITHFFAVAQYGAINLRKNGGSLAEAYGMIRSAFRIVYPLMRNEKTHTRRAHCPKNWEASCFRPKNNRTKHITINRMIAAEDLKTKQHSVEELYTEFEIFLKKQPVSWPNRQDCTVR